MKKTWKTISEDLKHQKNSMSMKSSLKKIVVTNKTNKQEISNQFNKYFINVGPTLVKKFPKIKKDDPTKLITQHVEFFKDQHLVHFFSSCI